MTTKSEKHLKPLSTLPQNGKSFRIDAFGPIRRNPYSSTNHLIDIVVSELFGVINFPTNTTHSNPTNPKHQERYQISVGEFFSLPVGSVLRDGEIISRPSQHNFEDVIHATPDKIRFIPADLKHDALGRNNYLIPPYIYQMGAALRSTLLAIELGGDPYAILIPTMEILRECYCSSSVFNQLIFSPGIDDFAYSTTKSYFINHKKKILDLCLRKNFPDADAIIIGNILTNNHAQKEIKKVWASLVKQTYLDQVGALSALEIGFPFLGKIHLQAVSIDLPSPFPGRKRKLLTTILGCNYPLPFSGIELQRENPGSQRCSGECNGEQGKNEEMEKQSGLWLADVENTDDGVNDPFALPSGYVKKAFLETPSNRFSFVKVTKVEQKVEMKPRNPSAHFPPLLQLIHQSTSDPTYGQSHSAPISIVPKEATNTVDEEMELVTANFDNFNEICNRLEKSPHVKHIEPVIINGHPKNNNYTSQFPLKNDNGKLAWSIITEKGVYPRPRQLMIKRVCTHTVGEFYVMEIERKKTGNTEDRFAIYLFMDDHRSYIPENILDDMLLKLAADHFKRYRETFSAFRLQVQPRRHTGTIDDCVDSILRKAFQCF